jgi:hypothetical protein
LPHSQLIKSKQDPTAPLAAQLNRAVIGVDNHMSHENTILALETNGQPLPELHSAPI